MNKVFLITVGVIIALGVIGFAVLLIYIKRPDSGREIAKASAEFKADQNFRSEPAKKLIEHLKIGMTLEEVESLLGNPNKKKESNGSLFWFYILGYSQYLDIQFDSDGKVKKIESRAPGLGDTGYYKLEK
jgi:outer membrane protein assembly factor BamE (lipoprotein component of BamABCDE complex)